jgi:uncharacterized protein
MGTTDGDSEQIIAMTQRWLEKSVIGLNLCPFAAGPYRGGRVRFFVSAAASDEELLHDLGAELQVLMGEDPEKHETTLLIHPHVLNDFGEYNQFLDVCDALIESLELAGEVQVASFHPHYQFADTAPEDIENFTNRSPYPTLHLLREESVSRAVEAGDTEGIYLKNIRTLRELGPEGWSRLWREQ